MNKYLDKPCGRCGEYKLQPWYKSGMKNVTLCAHCGKHMGVKVHKHVDKSQGYELYMLGGASERKTVLTSKRLYAEYARLTGGEINRALDKAVKSGILCIT